MLVYDFILPKCLWIYVLSMPMMCYNVYEIALYFDPNSCQREIFLFNGP